MTVIRRMMVEEEVEAPPDLISQAEACRTYGIKKQTLLWAMGRYFPAYVVPGQKAKRGGKQGPMVSRADIEQWQKPIFTQSGGTMYGPGYRKAFEKFFRTEAEETIMRATVAGYGGPSEGYSVELFEDGTYRILDNKHIGNLYQSAGMLIDMPKLSDDEVGDEDAPAYYDDALAQLREKFELAMEGEAV